MSQNTIASLLDKTTAWFKDKGLDSPRLDAELLLCHVLQEPRIKLYMDPDRPLDDDEVARFRAVVKQRGASEPVAYILGEKDFWGRTFHVDSNVLIPRPDTERLIELCLELLPPDVEGRIVDLGTGSGCIAVTLAAERPGLFVVATDVSEGALHVAKQNAERHGVRDRVALRMGDLWDACPQANDLLLVVSNPPYIPRSQEEGLMPDVRDHEPHLALFDDDDVAGVSFHRRILQGAESRLRNGGKVVMEIGFDQAAAMRDLTNNTFQGVEVVDDYGGNPRVAVFQRHPRIEQADVRVEHHDEHENHKELQDGQDVHVELLPQNDAADDDEAAVVAEGTDDGPADANP